MLTYASRTRTAHRISALVAALALAASAAAEVPRPEISDLRALFRAAIDSPDGRAVGVLRTPEADALTRQVGMRTPVLVDVDTQTAYAQEGCRRLRVTFRLDGVILAPGAAPQRRVMQYGLNYCRDGQPPKSLAVKGAN